MVGYRFDSMLILAVHGNGHRLGLILLVVIVIAALAYLGVRLSERRSTRSRYGEAGTAPRRWSAMPQEPPGTPPEKAMADAGPTDGSPPPPRLPDDRGATPVPVASDVPRQEEPGAVTTPATVHPDWVPTSRGGDWAVETHGLTKRFGTTIAVNNVALLVPRGCAFGYLGPNGAGKTTLMRTLLGLTRADSGTMSLLGIPVPRERSRALARVGAIVDEPRFHDHLTGRENLQLLAAARGADTGERIDPGLARVGLTERADDKVAAYSMGMRQRLGVAACLLSDPELLILDEPMNGLDPAGMYDMRSMIKNLVSEGRTVMLSSHLLDEVERTCDTVAIVDRGSVIRQGPIEELLHGTTGMIVEVECDDAASAARALSTTNLASAEVVEATRLTVTLPVGAGRERIAELNRRLVEAGVSVYSLREVRTTLENWFLSVTSRFGERG